MIRIHKQQKENQYFPKNPADLRAGWISLALGLLACCLLLIAFSPSWLAFRAWSRVPEYFCQLIEVRRGAIVALQVSDPVCKIDDSIHQIVRWRLLMPSIGFLLHLPGVVVLSLSHAGCILVLGYVARLGEMKGRQETGRKLSELVVWGDSLALAILFGASSWFFTSMGWLGYFDSWIVFGLLLTAYARSPWLVAIVALLIPWIDERYVLGYPLAMAIRWVIQEPGWHLKSTGKWVIRQALPSITVILLYVPFRLWLAGYQGSPTLESSFNRVAVFDLPAWRWGFGIWEGLRIGWIMVIAAIWGLTRDGRVKDGLMIFFIVLATIFIGLLTANDLSRSVCIVATVIPLGFWHLRCMCQRLWLELRPAWVLALLTILLPAHHVVSDFTMPVNNLWQELRALGNPPPPLSASHYMKKAEILASRNDYRRATFYASVAERLEPVSDKIKQKHDSIRSLWKIHQEEKTGTSNQN